MHHLMELLTNPFVVITLIILFAGEYIKPIKIMFDYIIKKAKIFGEWFLETYEYKLYKEKAEWIENKRVEFRIQNFFAKVIFFAIATLVVIFIEIFWELGFRKVTKKLEKSKFAIWSEEKIKNLNPYVVLALFGLPFIFMELVGIFAFVALASGHIYIGISLYIFKVFFFIPVHFVLHTGEEQLMSIKWFKRRYDTILEVLKWFKKSQTYVRVHNVSETIKAYMKAIKDNFFNRVALIKKAFEHGEALSPECQQLFDEISIKKSNNEKILKQEYQDFFDCVEKHIKEEKENI